MTSSVAPIGAKFGARTLWESTRRTPPSASWRAKSAVPTASAYGIGASLGPELGTSVSIATVVSLARKRSCT